MLLAIENGWHRSQRRGFQEESEIQVCVGETKKKGKPQGVEGIQAEGGLWSESPWIDDGNIWAWISKCGKERKAPRMEP